MSSVCSSPDCFLIERVENYIPFGFYDINNQIAQRVYTHIPCSKSASYSAFILSKKATNFDCPRCQSKINNIFYNKVLSNAILDFQNSFYLRNDESAKNSYNLALLLNKEEQFKYVTSICLRALNFIEIDTTLRQNLKLVLNYAIDRSVQTNLGLNDHLDLIESYFDDISACEEKSKKTNDNYLKLTQNTYVASYLSSIAAEKNKIAKIYLDNKMNNEAIERLQDSLFLYEKALNIQVLDFFDKSIILENLISNLINIADLLFFSEKINPAATQYKKAIEFLIQEIEKSKNIDLKNRLQSRLDEVYFSLSKIYYEAAIEFSENNENFKAMECYVIAYKTLTKMIEKKDFVKFVLLKISDKIYESQVQAKTDFVKNHRKTHSL